MYDSGEQKAKHKVNLVFLGKPSTHRGCCRGHKHRCPSRAALRHRHRPRPSLPSPARTPQAAQARRGHGRTAPEAQPGRAADKARGSLAGPGVSPGRRESGARGKRPAGPHLAQRGAIAALMATRPRRAGATAPPAPGRLRGAAPAPARTPTPAPGGERHRPGVARPWRSRCGPSACAGAAARRSSGWRPGACAGC